MYKNGLKKWVGMIFLLAICIFTCNTNVYADSAKSYYNITYEMPTNSDGTIKNITVSAQNGRFYIKILPYNYFSQTNKNGTAKTLEDAKNDSSIKVINENDIFIGGVVNKKKKTYTIANDYIKQNTDSATGRIRLIVLVYSADDSTDKYASQKYITSEDFSYVPENTSNKIESTSYGSEYCKWAQDAVSSGNTTYDATMKGLIIKTMAPCFSTTVSYNMSLAGLKSLQTKLVDFYNNTYKKYITDVNITGATQLPDMTGTGYIKVDNPNLKDQYKTLGSRKNDMLTCNTDTKSTFMYLYYDKETKENVTITIGNNTVNGVVSNDVEACTTQCREELVVSYGPPKAIIAGQCFTYEVEVKSKVTCVASVNYDNFPNVTDFMPCNLKAHCNSSGNYNEQAGPSEKFDSCVNSCDGGKYSQACINSCYNDVYAKSSNKTSSKDTVKTSNTTTDSNKVKKLNLELYTLDTLNLNNNSKAAVKKVANVEDEALPSNCPSGDPNSDPSIIAQVYNYVNQNITGRYSINGNGVISYTPRSNCQWSKYGYSYFRDLEITARTVCNDAGYDWKTGSTTCAGNNHAACYNDSSCFPGKMRVRKQKCDKNGKNCYYYYDYTIYYSPSDGFKRSSVCKQSCAWVRADQSTSCHYIDRADAENGYIANVDKYITAISKCVSSAIDCNKEEATYTMAVNKDTEENTTKQTCDASNYNSNSNCLSWNNKHDKITKYDNLDLSKNSILELIGGSCAGASGTSGDWMYHTILTFPGAWIGNKHGEVLYDEPSEHKKWYTYHPGNYCTPITAKNVNANWWTWYQANKAGTTTKSFEELVGENKTNSLVYNIFTNVSNFGHFNWNFNLGCFYSTNDYTPSTPPSVPPVDEIPDCTSAKCPNTSNDSSATTDLDNYVSKSISTTTMFPSTKTSSTNKDSKTMKLSYVEKQANSKATSSTRTEGYNWSVDATNLSIEGYPVTPSSLVKKIEGTDSYADNEIDYDITLSTTNIRNIKSLSDKSNFSYVDYGDGEYTTVTNPKTEAYKTAGYSESDIPNYTYYKSAFIRDNSYVSTRVKVPGATGLTCNNLKDSNSCDLTLSGYTSSDTELSSWLSNIR